jgi:hypothetical protein
MLQQAFRQKRQSIQPPGIMPVCQKLQSLIDHTLDRAVLL